MQRELKVAFLLVCIAAQPASAKYMGCTITHQLAGAPVEVNLPALAAECFEEAWREVSGKNIYVATSDFEDLSTSFANGKLGVMITNFQNGEITAVMNSAAALEHMPGDGHIDFSSEPLLADGAFSEIARIPAYGYAGEAIEFEPKGLAAAVSQLMSFQDYTGVEQVVPDMPATAHMFKINCP